MTPETTFLKDFNKSPYKAFKKLNSNREIISNSFLDSIYSRLEKRLITKYFYQDIGIKEVTSFLFKKEREYTLYSIKKNKAFLKESHLAVLSNIALDKKDIEIYSFWNSLYKNIQVKVNNFDSYLNQLDLETLLVRLAIFYEYERFKNPNLFVDSPNKVAVIEKIIWRKLELGNFGTPSNSSDSFYDLFRKQLSFFKKNIIEFEILKSLYNTYDSFDNFEYLLDEYCLNEANASLVDKQTLKLIHDTDFRLSWQINNSKNLAREHYLNNIIQILSKKSDNEKKSIHLLKYNLHKLEKEININGVSIPAELYIDLFEHLDFQLNTSWNLWVDYITEMKKGEINDTEILNFIYDFSNDRVPIDSFDYNHEPNKEKIIKELTILDWASNDFNNPSKLIKQKKIDLSLKPFVKFGTQYITLSGILSNKNYGDILATKVRLLGNKKEYGTNFEKQITDFLETNSFMTYSGKYVKNKDKGEFDILAYKDGYLFIIETKVSKGRLSIQDIENHKQNSLTKILNQLEKNYTEIKDDFKNLKVKLKIQENFDELILVPLAITNNFEFEEIDYKSENYTENIKKISAFELELILNDTLCILYDDPSFLLWRTSHSKCPSETLYNSIKQRTVWSMLIENIKSEDIISQTHSFGEFKVFF